MDFIIPRSTTTILLVGHAGIGKRRLASYIRSEVTSQPLQQEQAIASELPAIGNLHGINTDVNFRTAESLSFAVSGPGAAPKMPLIRPFNNDQQSIPGVMESVTRYDLILFMVNMSNHTSWEDCKQSLLQLDPGWFLGHCAIVITRVAAVSKYAFDRDDVTNFLEDFYDIPTIWTNLDVDREATLAALQVVRMLEVGAGYRRPDRVPDANSTWSGFGPSTNSWRQLLTSSSAVRSVLGDRVTATHHLMRTPEKYIVEMTTFSDNEDGDVGEVGIKNERGEINTNIEP
ncbi:hypothetical protein BX616_000914 [Lobosporangium transversale]|uniref:Centromere protein M n=1 Tax=Lobosporangium transversale TaxID=64571 RepID=A0A1Y2GS23_9FUNG|nr:hypothetical protein BCR41DRAFT_420988 [Lobosporangium transversale]KAF9917460.1 hypothetical protein BX616_000914 [Lobosporangium transversale]ORZ20959.1 hypothetical protein BCR41DRAFT_420988 [Lobosporangium transversale]|eukprot:XP_021882868.1 hypothetical protein BCR41DRAFT_420988 [Lobosporangium transversale]